MVWYGMVVYSVSTYYNIHDNFVTSSGYRQYTHKITITKTIVIYFKLTWWTLQLAIKMFYCCWKIAVDKPLVSERGS